MAENAALAALYAIRDVGLDEPATDDLAERVRQAVAQEIAREHERGGPRRARRHGWRAGSIVIVLSTAVTIAVAGVLVALLHHNHSGGQSSAASARSLVARLAVLRRPQTAADLLPAHPRLVHQTGTIIPSLTRLVATPPGAKLYLVVSTAQTGPDALWSPKLGDQVSIVTVTAHDATDTLPIPAADLTDAREIFPGGRMPNGPGTALHPGLRPSAYEVSVVPDGVARVRWTFDGGPGKPDRSVNAQVHDNVAYAPYGPTGGIPLRGTWYAADGTVIPTSDRLLRQAEADRQAAMKAAAIREYAGYSYHAPRRLVASFAVFSVTSRTPVHTASGVTISRPPLSALPFTIVDFADPRQPPRLDLSQIRQITVPSGITVWVIPGERGMCLASIDRPIVPDIGGGGGATCTSNLAQAEHGGVGMSTGGAGRPQTTYRLLPTSKPALRIRVGPHSFRTVRPPWGVYVATTPSHR